jgi:hypothetical protein
MLLLRIFPRATDQAKKVVLKGTLVCQILFQGKRKPSLQTRTLSKDLTSNNPFLEGAKQSLSSPAHLPLTEYKKKEEEEERNK